MRLVFVKGAGKNDALTIHRTGHASETIDCPKQRIIPHDMVHYAVESVLNARGFLGRVANGERGDFMMAAEAESDGVERLVEVMQGDGWSGGGTAAADLIDLYRVTCRARGCPPLTIDEATIDAIRDLIADLTGCWDAVPVGGDLTLEFSAPH